MWLTVLVTSLLAATPAQEAAPDSAREVRAGAGSLGAALHRAIADPAAQPLRLWARSWVEDGFSSVELFGHGAAIWNGRAAFDLPRAELSALLARVEASGFLEMPELYGGPAAGRPAGPIRIVRELELTLGDHWKRVEQRAPGEESQELRELILDLLQETRAPGERGRSAPDLTTGLALVAEGALPAESLTLRLHDKPELGAAGPDGYLLETRGRRVTIRDLPLGAEPAEGHGYELTEGDFRQLVRGLAARGPGQLPSNLYSERYVEVTIEVLDRRLSTQARRFAGIDGSTHGDLQQDFEVVLELLRSLYRTP